MPLVKTIFLSTFISLTLVQITFSDGGQATFDLESCRKQGGSPLDTFLGDTLCNLPTQDAGKPCKDDSDCESICTLTKAHREQISEDLGEAQMVCYEKTQTLGSCLPRIKSGKILGILCTD